jgi:hypothetical protein
MSYPYPSPTIAIVFLRLDDADDPWRDLLAARRLTLADGWLHATGWKGERMPHRSGTDWRDEEEAFSFPAARVERVEWIDWEAQP